MLSDRLNIVLILVFDFRNSERLAYMLTYIIIISVYKKQLLEQLSS